MIPLFPQNTLCIATSNKGKQQEITTLFDTHSFNIKVISIDSFPYIPPDENGKNFAENAAIKADYACKLTGFASLADDSGLCVEALNGQPGIHSARWANEQKDFTQAMQKILSLLEEKNAFSPAQRKAYFVCNFALAIPKHPIHNFEGQCHGIISSILSGDNGFGYDPIFIPKEKNLNNNRSFANMEPEEKRVLSHRQKAFKKLCFFIQNHLM